SLLMLDFGQARMRNPNPTEFSSAEIKLLSSLIAPMRSLYLRIKNQKKDLYRYYEKKRAEKHSSLINKVRLQNWVHELKHYNNVELAGIEDHLQESLQLFVRNTEGLSEQRLREIESSGTTLAQDEKSEECAICLEVEENAEVFQLPCKHTFHKSCVMGWFEEHTTCPMCRTDVLAEKD
ncbi:MAG: hypothetical protein OXT67_10690, partial [Zetaproteobacteria bacterium]|nr:hypothetical protein [Zetaproteobacteria bacterium]